MRELLAVGLGGGIGAIARYLVSLWMQRRFPGFPASGTLLVNVAGCLLIGILMGLIVERNLLSPAVRLLLITGFLGGLTTFSSFGAQTLELFEAGHFRLTLIYLAGNLIGGLFAVWLGVSLVRLWCR